MAEENRCDVLGNLPIELVLKIFSLLDFKDLLMTQAVSKTWFGLVNCDDVWKRFLPDDYPDKEISPRRGLDCGKSFKSEFSFLDFHWLVLSPCQVKMKVLNHYRILKNWRDNKFNRFELKNTELLTAYDGKTLVISLTFPSKGFNVYQVERGKVWQKQTIKTNFTVINLATNSRFIVAHAGSYVYVYQLEQSRKRVYKMAYLLSKSSENGVVRLPDALALKVHKKAGDDNNELESVVALILGNTLFGFTVNSDPAIRSLYAWELENEDLLLMKDIKARAHRLSTDGKQVYCWTENRITVFDHRGDVIYEVEREERILRVLTNANLLIALTMKDSPDYSKMERLPAGPLMVTYTPGMACYDKSNGALLFYRHNVTTSIYSLLDPRLDVLYDISDDSMVSAITPSSGLVSWNSYMADTALGALHCIGGERCLLVSSFSGREYHAYDTRTGKYKYFMLDNDGYGLEAHYDIMLCYAREPASVVVLVYS